MILVNRTFQISSYVRSALLVVLPPALSAGAIPAGADPPGIRLLPLADGSHVVYARELLFDGTLWALSDLVMKANGECREFTKGNPDGLHYVHKVVLQVHQT